MPQYSQYFYTLYTHMLLYFQYFYTFNTPARVPSKLLFPGFTTFQNWKRPRFWQLTKWADFNLFHFWFEDVKGNTWTFSTWLDRIWGCFWRGGLLRRKTGVSGFEHLNLRFGGGGDVGGHHCPQSQCYVWLTRVKYPVQRAVKISR